MDELHLVQWAVLTAESVMSCGIIWFPSRSLFRSRANDLSSFWRIISSNSKMVKWSCHKLAPIDSMPTRDIVNIQESITGFNLHKSPKTITLTPPKGFQHPFISCNLKFMKLNILFPTIDISSMNTIFKWKNLHLIESSWCISRGLNANPLPTGIPNA